MWDSVSLAEITEHIAEVEQQRALCAWNEMGAARQSIITCEDVPEQARMFDVNIVSNDEAKTVELGFGRHAHESDGRIVVEEINLMSQRSELRCIRLRLAHHEMDNINATVVGDLILSVSKYVPEFTRHPARQIEPSEMCIISSDLSLT